MYPDLYRMSIKDNLQYYYLYKSKILFFIVLFHYDMTASIYQYSFITQQLIIFSANYTKRKNKCTLYNIETEQKYKEKQHKWLTETIPSITQTVSILFK